jgi:predicted NBD/HSP70 family sugar kinase
LRPARVDLGQRSETVRRANLSAIVRRLHERGPLSRSELVATTGLTRSAIRGLVRELADAGFVSEDDAVRLGTPGRPSPLVRLHPDRAVVVAVEILVDSVAAALVGLGGETIAQRRDEITRGHLAVGEVVGHVASLVEDLAPPTDERLVGIGVAVAGVVRRADGLVSMAPNLGWRDEPLGALLNEALQVGVPISIANEADAGVLAEHRRGAAIGIDDVLYVSGEVGVGGGVIVGGVPLTGAAGYAGEIGHLPLNPDGQRCRCGSIGCWETEIGEGQLLSLAGRLTDAGSAGVEAVLADAAAGDPAALAALERIGRWIGIGLAGLVNVLNPRLVILGAMLGRIYPFARAAIEPELASRALPAPGRLVRIVPATLGVDAPLQGAAELAFEPLLSDPAARFLPREDISRAATA